jgi:hypothetical protein
MRVEILAAVILKAKATALQLKKAIKNKATQGKRTKG